MTSLDLRLRRIYRVPGTTEEYQLVTKFHRFEPCFRMADRKARAYGDVFIDKKGTFADWYKAIKQKDGTYEYAYIMNLEEVNK